MNQIHLRPYKTTDLQLIHTLIATATASDRTQHVTHAELRAIPDPEHTTAVSFLPDGTITGFAWWDSNKYPAMPFYGCVHPIFRGQGVGTALVNAALVSAKALGATELTTRVYSDIPGAVEIFLAAGFVEERRYYAMWRDLDDSLLDLPHAPAGVSIRPYRPETDAYAVYEADSEAFSSAWRVQSQSFDTWRTQMANHNDPALWAIAWIDEHIAGVCISRRSDFGSAPDDGWIGHLGVRPAYQRRGIGRFLLYEGFNRLRRAGFDRAGLHVDSQNMSALSLYESAGMKKQRERVHLALNLNP